MKLKKALYIFLSIVLVLIILHIFRGDSFSLGDIFGTSDVIVIDPGHGGHDPGTIGINNTYEKDINLEISKKLYERLKSMDYKVILTRDTDEYIHNMERIELANKFLSSKKESALLITDEYQNKIVNGIVNGLEKYLNF
jgi:N-acetylmuramoyl-L-alanine amidase